MYCARMFLYHHYSPHSVCHDYAQGIYIAMQGLWTSSAFIMHTHTSCIFFGMPGVAVPSLTSFAYYLVFLTVLVIWSFHQTVRMRVVVRVLRCILTFYTMVHLIVLYLYQFQAAQQNIPLLPDDTGKSLLARYIYIYIIKHVHMHIHVHMYTYRTHTHVHIHVCGESWYTINDLPTIFSCQVIIKCFLDLRTCCFLYLSLRDLIFLSMHRLTMFSHSLKAPVSTPSRDNHLCL